MYYSSDCTLSEEDAKTIRVSLLNLVKFYIVKEITLEELNQLLHFMIACKEENMVGWILLLTYWILLLSGLGFTYGIDGLRPNIYCRHLDRIHLIFSTYLVLKRPLAFWSLKHGWIFKR